MAYIRLGNLIQFCLFNTYIYDGLGDRVRVQFPVPDIYLGI